MDHTHPWSVHLLGKLVPSFPRSLVPSFPRFFAPPFPHSFCSLARDGQTKAGRVFAMVYAVATLPVFAHALSLTQSYAKHALAPKGAHLIKTLAITGIMV